MSISRTTAYGLIAKGELPVIRVGRSVRVHPRELERFLANHSSAPLEQAA
jgi:excisionase family DNA binding protein